MLFIGSCRGAQIPYRSKSKPCAQDRDQKRVIQKQGSHSSQGKQKDGYPFDKREPPLPPGGRKKLLHFQCFTVEETFRGFSQKRIHVVLQRGFLRLGEYMEKVIEPDGKQGKKPINNQQEQDDLDPLHVLHLLSGFFWRRVL